MALVKEKSSENSKDTGNALSRLQALFSEDMKHVNALILQNMQSDVALIPQLAQYLVASGGKRVRPLLTLASTKLLNGDMERAYGLSACVEFIHTATLLHDDVVDESMERRGKASANAVFGNQASVLVGDFLFSRAFELMVADGSLDILRVLSKASAVIAEGEVLQLSTANNLETSKEDYLKVIESKTAALFAAACEVGAILSGNQDAERKAMRDFGLNFGIAFQIIDDVLDYTADQNALGKNVGDDFQEGKITLPVLFALEHATPEEKQFFEKTYVRKEQEDEDIQEIIALIHRYEGFSKSRAIAKEYAGKAENALSLFGEGSEHGLLKEILQDLILFSLQRTH